MGIARKMIGAGMRVLTLSGIAMVEAFAGEPPPPIERARDLIAAEQFEAAVAILKQLDPSNNVNSAGIDLLFGRIYLSIGKPAKALGFFEDASFASLEGEAEAYLGRAEAELALGDLAKARRYAGLALKSDPDLVAAQLVLARADQRLGLAEQASARLRRLQHDRPESEDVAVILARYLAERDSPTVGIAELRRFLALYPTAAGAQDVLGQLLWASGQKAEAVSARSAARQLYLDRGQSGRADAMTAWLKAVAPQGRGELAPPPPINVEPPPPKADPTVPVKATPLPDPAARKVTQAVALSHPEPLPFAPGSAIMTGSGIVLEGGRQIITNRHVVDGLHSIAVRNGTGHVRIARVSKVSSDDDLALLEIDKPFPEGAVTPLSDIVDPAPGRAAIVMGFPMISVLGDEQPALTEGIVAKTIGLSNDPNTFQMTAKINKGNSGGPVFDKAGRLLGVAVGKMDAAGIYQKSGVLVEDMNLGIKGSRILAFLGKAPTRDAAPVEMSLEDLYQQMLPRAVLVAGQK